MRADFGLMSGAAVHVVDRNSGENQSGRWTNSFVVSVFVIHFVFMRASDLWCAWSMGWTFCALVIVYYV